MFNRVSLAIGHQLINCSDKELVTLEPPTGQTCGEFMARYISSRGGYLTNPDASTTCHFCSSRTTDEWMGPTFNIFYQNHWRDFGLFCVYIIFNVSFVSIYLWSVMLNRGYFRFVLSIFWHISYAFERIDTLIWLGKNLWSLLVNSKSRFSY